MVGVAVGAASVHRSGSLQERMSGNTKKDRTMKFMQFNSLIGSRSRPRSRRGATAL